MTPQQEALAATVAWAINDYRDGKAEAAMRRLHSKGLAIVPEDAVVVTREEADAMLAAHEIDHRELNAYRDKDSLETADCRHCARFRAAQEKQFRALDPASPQGERPSRTGEVTALLADLAAAEERVRVLRALVNEPVDTGLSELTVARLASLYESYQWPVLPPRVSRSRHLAEYVVAALREDARLRAALEPKPSQPCDCDPIPHDKREHREPRSTR